MKGESASKMRLSTWMTGAALGAVAMYFSDPDRGRRRRALAQDRMRHYSTKATHAADVAMRDFGNRMTGLQARTRNMMPSARSRQSVADDGVVAARVRARLGRTVSHPHAIHVTVHQGCVNLEGPILARESQQLLEAVRSTPGVSAVEDRLQMYESAEGIPSLQGGRQRTGMQSEFLQTNWAPAVRGAAVLAGSALGWFGMMQRSAGGMALAGAGLTLLVRGMTNTPLRRLIGIGAGHRVIDLQKTIKINASPEVVWDAWARYDNFPHFMSHVLEVRDLGDLRSHWVVQGPVGARMEWDAVLTECIRPTVLAWSTEPGAAVQHDGIVRFEPYEDGTRVTVRLSYNPPAGALGHGVAVLLGRDPKRELDDDLMRMKSFIETGIVPHDAAGTARRASASSSPAVTAVPSMSLH